MVRYWLGQWPQKQDKSYLFYLVSEAVVPANDASCWSSTVSYNSYYVIKFILFLRPLPQPMTPHPGPQLYKQDRSY